MKRYSYTVVGKVPFPLDMLRYDASFPANQEAVAHIQASIDRDRPREPVEIQLIASASMPTPARWESFMWQVLPETVRRV